MTIAVYPGRFDPVMYGQMAFINHQLCPEVEAVCLMAGQRYSFLSSSAVKELVELGADISAFVLPQVRLALRRALSEREEDRL